MTASEMGSFFENMAMLIKSGITPAEALELLSEDAGESEKGASGATYAAMAEQLSAGHALADAMRSSKAFPDYAVEMVDASEYTGKLEGTLFHLSDYYRTEHSMRTAFVSAVRYPFVLLLMVIAVLIVMLVIVFPAFRGVYSNLTGSLSAASAGYIGVSFTLCRILLVIMALLFLLLLAGVLMWRSGKADTVKKALSRLRIFRQLLENLDLYRFTSCFDMFIASGSLQDEAIEKSMPVVEGDALKQKLQRCIEKMQAGASFSQVACDETLYDPLNNRMLVPAERSGMLDTILQKILLNLKNNNEAYTAGITGTVEPFLTGFLMITLGLTLISLMVPLIGIMNSIG